MNSKKFDLIISNIIVVASIVILIIVLHHTFDTKISHPILDTVLVLIAILIYIFLADSMVDTILKSDKELKNLVDETLHELNTPIATIEANLSMLKKSVTNEKSIKRLKRIEEASKNLTKLYESIEYEIKENIEQVEKTTFDLKELIDNSILKFDEIKDGINIVNRVPNIAITTDKNGFIKTIDNLISNGIKYNKKDGFLEIYLQDKILYFKDSGIGIDTKNLFIVFDKSYQENPATKGFGIGLSIVKSFCDKHKIKIKIETKKDIGTTIGLDLTNVLQKD